MCNGDSSKSVEAESIMFHSASASSFGMVGKHDLSLARDTARRRGAYNPRGILSSLSTSRTTQGVSPRLTFKASVEQRILDYRKVAFRKRTFGNMISNIS